jgi:fatty acid desaturase
MRALGFSAIFLPPLLLVAGRVVEFDWLLPLFFFVGIPALRPIFGSLPEGGIRDWTDRERRVLELMPRLYVIPLALVVSFCLWTLNNGLDKYPLQQIGFALAMLVLGGVASCVAHDLMHRRREVDRILARLIMSLVFYPFFVDEHLEHHQLSRDTDSAHCPRNDESFWTFVFRRGFTAPLLAWLSASRRRGSIGQSLWLYLSLTLLLTAAFVVAGGWYGLGLAALLFFGVPLLLNGITYIQHWGLGDDTNTLTGQGGWDEDSVFQNWLILGISSHMQHHQTPALAYYEYGPSRASPRLPADYAVMFILAMVPPLWRLVMEPRCKAWSTKPELLVSPGRNVYARLGT